MNIWTAYYQVIRQTATRMKDDQLLVALVRVYNAETKTQEEIVRRHAEFAALWDELAYRWPSVFHA